MIKEFQEEYRWLSNFAPVKIKLDGLEYPSVEHAYMSAKSNDFKWKGFCANADNSAAEVKKKSREVQLVDNWNGIKLSIMEKCLEQKFNTNPYENLLISTGDEYIQEGNRWNDTYWGVCLKTNKGENHLGLLIMKIRKNLML